MFRMEVIAQSNSSEVSDAAKAHNAQISASYTYPFGKAAFSAPGNARTTTGGFIQAGEFPKAEYCQHCHPQAYAQWRQALHSNSFRTPFYRTSVNILARTKGIEFTRHCDSCHNPVSVLSGALTPDSHVDRQFDADGVTCMTCHSVESLQPTLGNGSFVMDVPAVMVDENGKRIPGEVPDEQIMQHPERHAQAVMKDFYRSPEFCASCHKANLPNQLNGYKWIRAFTTYDEWENSKFSTRNPLTFYKGGLFTCQSCHMMRETADKDEDGAKKGTFASHRWLAGNTAVPFYYGYDEQLQKTIDFLKSGNYLNVDVFGIKNVESGKIAAPLGSTGVNLFPGELVQAIVVVQNKNIGHSLIPEVRDLYEAWVEFSVQDGMGKTIYDSGFVNSDGTLDTRAHSFTNRPVDVSGEFVDNHKVWAIHSVAYDNTIQSGRSALVRYQFRIPKDVRGPLTLTARVNYRHFRQSYLNNVFGPDHPAYPIVELAARTRVLNVGANGTSAVLPGDNPDWMRWNNLGIADLDQLQYADALKAFEQALTLRPDYPDGWINIALTKLEWEKYPEAREPLEKALQLSPGNARALYYMGLVERRSGNCDAEVNDFQQVVAQYPDARDARRELGISYYQTHRYAEARVQFEALQRIDPDDLAAHYNLAVIYRRLGMKDKAAQQAALFATKQVDPGAPTYSLNYLRQHPEISIESVPMHVHTDEPQVTANGSAVNH